MNKTTCLNCKKICDKRELDEFYECLACQESFVKSLVCKKQPKKQPSDPYSWIERIPSETKKAIISDAESMIAQNRKFKSIRLFLVYVLEVYDIKFTIGDFYELRKLFLKENPTYIFKNKKIAIPEFTLRK
jgi:hypothetical protein